LDRSASTLGRRVPAATATRFAIDPNRLESAMAAAYSLQEAGYAGKKKPQIVTAVGREC
jgi:hypothetical protein